MSNISLVSTLKGTALNLSNFYAYCLRSRQTKGAEVVDRNVGNLLLFSITLQCLYFILYAH